MNLGLVTALSSVILAVFYMLKPQDFLSVTPACLPADEDRHRTLDLQESIIELLNSKTTSIKNIVRGH